MGQLWDLVETWRDGLEFPPSYRQIALKLGVTSTAFTTWKNPTELPHRRNLLGIARLTGVPYRRVVDAAIEDTKLYDEAAAEETLRPDSAFRRGGVPVFDAEPFSVDEAVMQRSDP